MFEYIQGEDVRAHAKKLHAWTRDLVCINHVGGLYTTP